LLIQALGGGWDVNLLPTKKELEQDFSLLPQLPPERAGLRLPSPADGMSTTTGASKEPQFQPRPKF
jgi:hypothetical protein